MYLFLLFSLWGTCLPFYLSSEMLKLDIDAESAILMNAASGVILYEKEPHKSMYPASVTKIATVLVALKVKGDFLDERIVVDQECVASVSEEAKMRSNYALSSYLLTPDGTHMGLKKGEELTLRDLLHGIMLVSANDASNVVAKHLGQGSISDFMAGLNQYLKEIGCSKTSYNNPHGLYHPKHKTTAYDLALMTREGLKNPLFCQIVSTVQYQCPKSNLREGHLLMQSNKLLRKGKYYYDKAIGVKTGYLSKAGHTLVAAALHEDRVLIAVLLKSKDRHALFSDAVKMFETAFNQPKIERTLLPKGNQRFVLPLEGAISPIQTYLSEELVLSYYSAEEPKIKCLLYWDECSPPIAKNQKVGEIRIQDVAGQTLMKAALDAQDDVGASWSFRVKRFMSHGWKTHPFLLVFIAAGALGSIFYFAFLIQKGRNKGNGIKGF